ncbi:MAG TPA: MarR family transcriptional regulator [Stellaceae bacterium]|nr:MarR family transcriptional regulator [Stellaceae bacterium]
MDAGRPAEAVLSFLVRDLARLLRRRFEQGAAGEALGLTRNQSFVLVYVAERQGLSQARLAELLQIEPMALVHLVDRLEALGLMERRLDPRDRRIWRLYLTPAAAPALEQIRRINRAVGADALADLPADERALLIALLRQLKSTLAGAARLNGAGVSEPPSAA